MLKFDLIKELPRPLRFLLLLILILWIATPSVSGYLASLWMVDVGAIGDLFGSVNSLFSGLALGGVVWALIIQQTQLSKTQDQLDLTTKQFKLMHDQLELMREQLELMREQLKLTRDLQDKALAQTALIEFNRRFDLVLQIKFDVRRSNVDYFYNSFFSLQRDQFRFWVEGIIPDEVFKYWIASRQRQYDENERLEGIAGSDYRSNWDKFKNQCEPDEFIYYFDLAYCSDHGRFRTIINKLRDWMQQNGKNEQANKLPFLHNGQAFAKGMDEVGKVLKHLKPESSL
jgi:hypothetical protein